MTSFVPMSDDECLAAVALIDTHGSIRNAARMTGIPRSTIQDRLRAARARGLYSAEDDAPPGLRVDAHSVAVNKSGEVEREITRYRPQRGPEYQPKPGDRRKFTTVTQVFDEDGNGRVAAQVERWEAPRVGGLSQDEIAAIIRETLTPVDPTPAAPPRPALDGFAAYIVTDLHLGARAWAAETGEHYDLQTAIHTYDTCSARLFEDTRPTDTALLLTLGDHFQVDNATNMTRRSGNPQDVSDNYQYVIREALTVERRRIERAKQKHKHVIVRYMPGNHDDETSQWLGIALAVAYENDPAVTVDTTPGYWWAYEYGNVLLTATHGHQVRDPKDISLTVSDSYAPAWGRTTYRYCFLGHNHKAIRMGGDVGGLWVEWLRGMTARSSWAAEKGYTSRRSMHSIVFDAAAGEVERKTASVSYPRGV